MCNAREGDSMIWTFLGAVASLLAIFSFVTGITSLRQLFRVVLPGLRFAIDGFINRAPQLRPPRRPDVSQPRRNDRGHDLSATTSAWAVLAGRTKFLSALVALSAIGACIGAMLLPRQISWMPHIVPIEITVVRGAVIAVLIAGSGYPFVLVLLRRRGLLDREEAAMLRALPLVGLVALLWLGSFGRSFTGAIAAWLLSSAATAFIFAVLTMIEVAMGFVSRNEA